MKFTFADTSIAALERRRTIPNCWWERFRCRACPPYRTVLWTARLGTVALLCISLPIELKYSYGVCRPWENSLCTLSSAALAPSLVSSSLLPFLLLLCSGNGEKHQKHVRHLVSKLDSCTQEIGLNKIAMRRWTDDGAKRLGYAVVYSARSLLNRIIGVQGLL